jgi:hypothetical protein
VRQWVNRLRGIEYPLPKPEGNSSGNLGGARSVVGSPKPKPQPQQLSPTQTADPVVQGSPDVTPPPPLPDSRAHADPGMTHPPITQTPDSESDDGEHSQRSADSPVRPLQEIEQAATTAELEDPQTPHFERKASLSLTSNHLRAHDEVNRHQLAQQLQLRSDSTAVTVCSETPPHSPIASSEPATDTPHEILVEASPEFEESVVQPEEPTVVAQVEQRPPASPEALPPPRVSPPSTPPTASKEQNASGSFGSLQNDVAGVAEPSSSGFGANEEPVPELAQQTEPPADPSNRDTTELDSPTEWGEFVYPDDASPPDLVPATTVEPESADDDVFRYPTDEPVEPAPAEPAEPIAPAQRRTFPDRQTDLDDTSSRDPAPAHRPHSDAPARSQRYSLTQDMLPAPEVFSPVPVPIRASTLTSGRTATRDSFTPSRVDGIDYSRYSPRPRQTGSPAPPRPASVIMEDVNDASSDFGDGSATGALGDNRRTRRRKKTNKTNRRSMAFSDGESEVIGSGSDWVESGDESGGAPATAVDQFDEHFMRHMSLPQVSSPLARDAAMQIVRDSNFSPYLADAAKGRSARSRSSFIIHSRTPSGRFPVSLHR